MPELRQRTPRVVDKAFLAFVRDHRCLRCGTLPPVQAAHLRAASQAHGKRETGKGEKPSDQWAVPLCADCHLDAPDALHKVGEERFFRALNVDPFAYARMLYSAFLASDSVSKVRPRKRKERHPLEIIARRRFTSSTDKSKPKMKSRPLRSANRWPPRGSRKIARRG